MGKLLQPNSDIEFADLSHLDKVSRTQYFKSFGIGAYFSQKEPHWLNSDFFAELSNAVALDVPSDVSKHSRLWLKLVA